MDKSVSQGSVRGIVTAPSSKSYAQRALCGALLANGSSTITNLTLCNDTAAVLDVIQRLGATVAQSGNGYTIHGGLNPQSNAIDIGESGLATRLFAPVVALLNRPMTITGKGSILTRPITMIEQPLRDLGARVTSGGYLPVTIEGTLKGGVANVDGSVSSQFLTGLLMALPLANNDSTLYVNNLKSAPYIDMTLEVLKSFGIEVVNCNYREFFIRGGQCYKPTEYNVEGDWSGASAILVAGATTGDIRVGNLKENSLQADRAIMDVFDKAGVSYKWEDSSLLISKSEIHPFEFDATDCPDLFPALVALGASAKGVCVIKGTNRLTHKESNRAETLRSEFEKIGIRVDISQNDIMRVEGGTPHGATTSSHNDHRIAMALAVTALRSEGSVVIERAEAVDKSYPSFWNDLNRLTGVEYE